MGQKRLTLVDLTQGDQQKKVSQKRVAKSAGKALGAGKRTGRIADKSQDISDIRLDEALTKPEERTAVALQTEGKKVAKEHKPRERSRRYKLARSKVDRTTNYPPDQAIELVKKTNIARFDSTVSAHLNLTQEKQSVDVHFPHSTGKQTRVEIATDAVLKNIEAKKIDFDILLASPAQMPKIAKVAKILGPLGLMPNPKNGTITDDPEKRKKELGSGLTRVKSEGKSPLMHVTIGKSSRSDKELLENLQALVSAVGGKQIKKLTLASTMSPGVKVDVSAMLDTEE